MKHIISSLFFSLFLLGSVTGTSYSATTSCRADGLTDVTSCLQNALLAAQQSGDAQLFLSKGTYSVSATIVVPSKVQLIGTGRGDKNLIGTVIAASASFPLHGVVVQMGVAGAANFAVQVKNLTIDGGRRADYGLQNKSSMELSYGEDLLISNFLKAGLDIESSAAQNSGPFRNLEIYPGSGPTVTTDTRCIIVRNVIAFRGIQGVTCNASEQYLTRPEIALQLDGAGVYSSIHVEHFGTAVHLGSDVNSADGLVFMNGEFGPDVDSGIVIDKLATSQNLSFFGVSCDTCSAVLNDQITGRTARWALGSYLMGNGAGDDKKVLSTDHGIVDKVGVFQQ
jgi:Pectate lyase superfamily protein